LYEQDEMKERSKEKENELRMMEESGKKPWYRRSIIWKMYFYRNWHKKNNLCVLWCRILRGKVNRSAARVLVSFMEVYCPSLGVKPTSVSRPRKSLTSTHEGHTVEGRALASLLRLLTSLFMSVLVFTETCNKCSASFQFQVHVPNSRLTSELI
jgi:hypothetical protein